MIVRTRPRGYWGVTGTAPARLQGQRPARGPLEPYDTVPLLVGPGVLVAPDPIWAIRTTDRVMSGGEANPDLAEDQEGLPS